MDQSRVSRPIWIVVPIHPCNAATPLIRTLFIVCLYAYVTQYGTDFYMLDKFPMSLRPFYTMPDPNSKVS